MQKIIYLIVLFLVIGVLIRNIPLAIVLCIATFAGIFVYRHIKAKEEAEKAYHLRKIANEAEQREREEKARLAAQVSAEVRRREDELKKAKEASKKKLAEADEKFNAMLSALPKHEIHIDNDSVRRSKKECEKHDISITNVTARTNIERLSDFVAFDVETTGLHGTHDEIIQLTAIRFQEWEPVEIFSTFVNPKKAIPEEASRVNNITDDMVASAPPIEAVIKDFDAFIGKSNLLGHNILFDLKFLDYAGSEYYQTKRKYYDTLELARLLDLSVINNKLSTLCEHFYIMDGKSAHRSDADALACGLLFKRLVDLKV